MTKSHSSYPSLPIDLTSTFEDVLEFLDDKEAVSVVTDHLLSVKRPQSRAAALEEYTKFVTPLDRLLYSTIMRLAHHGRYDADLQLLYMQVTHRGIMLVQFSLHELTWKRCHSILSPILGREQ